LGWIGRVKKTFTKKSKNIAGTKKGFYICTRLARERAGEEKEKVH